jgi:hypothetical protein
VLGLVLLGIGDEKASADILNIERREPSVDLVVFEPVAEMIVVMVVGPSWW